MIEYSPSAKYCDGNVIITGLNNFDLEQTFDCGQAFRWSKLDDITWHGIVFGRYIKISHSDGKVILYDTSLEEYEDKWRTYLDVDRNYGDIINTISSNDILKAAAEMNSGIRILKQEPWETLCSFIISQNNNIPRIKGIIERLCEAFGTKIDEGYTFPSAETIAALNPDDLALIRCGFRARYIIDGARKYANGDIDLDIIANGDTDRAREELMKITGVGNKVADCTLLFGFARIDALPKDVWIKRALKEYFGGELPEVALPYAGIVQQYIFNYARLTKLSDNK